MAINPYICFSGNCRDAVTFYAEVFNVPTPDFLTFGDMPENTDYPIDEKYKRLIMHTHIEILGGTIMFSDVFEDMPLTIGNSISIAVIHDNKKELKEYFEKLKVGGTIEMELACTDWSPLYGSLVDKFGVTWQFNQI